MIISKFAEKIFCIMGFDLFVVIRKVQKTLKNVQMVNVFERK